MTIVALLPLLITTPNAAEQQHTPVPRPEIPAEEVTPERLTREYCGACHSFRLVRSQRLNRATWAWVMNDMVTKFGAGWITPGEQRIITDYLVEHHGPEQD